MRITADDCGRFDSQRAHSTAGQSERPINDRTLCPIAPHATPPPTDPLCRLQHRPQPHAEQHPDQHEPAELGQPDPIIAVRQ